MYEEYSYFRFTKECYFVIRGFLTIAKRFYCDFTVCRNWDGAIYYLCFFDDYACYVQTELLDKLESENLIYAKKND